MTTTLHTSTSHSINVFNHCTLTWYDQCCFVLICEPQCVSQSQN